MNILYSQEDVSPPHLAGENVPRTNWDTFSGTVRTRLGMTQIGEMPNTVKITNPRVSSGFMFGPNNSFLGIDNNAPNSRFKNLPPEPNLPPSYFGPPIFPKNQSSKIATAESVTPIAPADVASQTPLPIRRSPNFFERTNVVIQENVQNIFNEASGDTEQRWFRDPTSLRTGLPQIGAMENGKFPSGTSPGIGAVSVGPELLQNDQSSRSGYSGNSSQNTQNQQSGKQIQTNKSASSSQISASSVRRFEQKLEGSLLETPDVHFLSPVRVSFLNGTATIRGVVTSQQDKVAAGLILLRDPNVQQVNNLISVVSADGTIMPAPIEPK
ncbi:MAG: BON domain-containing protein [Thermoguttaceae bacterium]